MHTGGLSEISMKPSMYCSECEVYTKKYDECGEHVCGNEVVSGCHDADINFEGHIEELHQ